MESVTYFKRDITTWGPQFLLKTVGPRSKIATKHFGPVGVDIKKLISDPVSTDYKHQQSLVIM